MNQLPVPISFHLEKEKETQALGKCLARMLQRYVTCHGSLAVLLNGELGSGKTALVRHITLALPGGEKSEISSPSFTICNIYPTIPQIWHCDLYRLDKNAVDEDIENIIEEKNCIAFFEWGDRLPASLLPDNRMEIKLHILPQGRKVTIFLYGSAGELTPSLQKLAPKFQEKK